MMRTQELPAFAARLVLPSFDEQCEELVRVIELLDLSPLHSIASGVFVSRFRVLLEAIETFFRHEEQLLNLCSMPIENRRLHLADHQRIREILSDICRDLDGKKNRTAIEVYEAIRFEIDRHVLTFSADLGRCLPARTH